MQKPDICLWHFLEKVLLTFPTRRKGCPVPARALFGILNLYWEKPKGMMGRVEITEWCRHSWVDLFLFPWNRPGKKQERTRKIFIESTNAPFLHAMETLYVIVSEERRENPAELFQATASLFWCQLFWGGACTVGESKERDRHWMGVRSIRSGENGLKITAASFTA